MSERKGVLLRLDPAVHDALARWAGDELRSTNAQIEFLLRRALAEADGCPATPARCAAPAALAAAAPRARGGRSAARGTPRPCTCWRCSRAAL